MIPLAPSDFRSEKKSYRRNGLNSRHYRCEELEQGIGPTDTDTCHPSSGSSPHNYSIAKEELATILDEADESAHSNLASTTSFCSEMRLRRAAFASQLATTDVSPRTTSAYDPILHRYVDRLSLSETGSLMNEEKSALLAKARACSLSTLESDAEREWNERGCRRPSLVQSCLQKPNNASRRWSVEPPSPPETQNRQHSHRRSLIDRRKLKANASVETPSVEKEMYKLQLDVHPPSRETTSPSPRDFWRVRSHVQQEEDNKEEKIDSNTSSIPRTPRRDFFGFLRTFDSEKSKALKGSLPSSEVHPSIRPLPSPPTKLDVSQRKSSAAKRPSLVAASVRESAHINSENDSKAVKHTSIIEMQQRSKNSLNSESEDSPTSLFDGLHAISASTSDYYTPASSMEFINEARQTNYDLDAHSTRPLLRSSGFLAFSNPFDPACSSSPPRRKRSSFHPYALACPSLSSVQTKNPETIDAQGLGQAQAMQSPRPICEVVPNTAPGLLSGKYERPVNAVEVMPSSIFMAEDSAKSIAMDPRREAGELTKRMEAYI